MIIEPQIQGVIARNCHPLGCRAAVKAQIDQAVKQTAHGHQLPKRVLILGASSGFGLASRIALSFGPAKAATIGVSFERAVSEKGIGSAGWYNNIAFSEFASEAQITSVNIVGDAFSESTRQQVAEAIINRLGGSVDLVVYSLATGVRPKPEQGEFWRSSIKPIGEAVSGYSLNFEQHSMVSTTLSPATEQEIEDTVRVMGGEDWLQWMQFLSNHQLLDEGCRTIAYSYIGPEHTHDIYHKGTLGHAKVHLHQTRHDINQLLAPLNGHADVAVCKALVTKASVFIPGLTPYLLALYRVMKDKGLHEGCIEQMNRLFYSKWNAEREKDTDGLIRLDDWELRQDVQDEVTEILAIMTPDNFKQVGDYQGVLDEFMQLNGFALDSIDYTSPTDIEHLKRLNP